MRTAVVVCILLLAGCAAMTESACGSSNCYQLGERDGLNGIPPRIDTYAYYMNGWWIGNATDRDRTAGSESN